jgi:hypothetical protein
VVLVDVAALGVQVDDALVGRQLRVAKNFPRRADGLPRRRRVRPRLEPAARACGGQRFVAEDAAAELELVVQRRVQAYGAAQGSAFRFDGSL